MFKTIFFKCLTLSFLAHLFLVALGLGVFGDSISPSLGKEPGLGKVLNVQIVDLLSGAEDQVSSPLLKEAEKPDLLADKNEPPQLEEKINKVEKIAEGVNPQEPPTEPFSEIIEKPVFLSEKAEQQIVRKKFEQIEETEKLEEVKESLDPPTVQTSPLNEKVEDASMPKDLFQLFIEQEHTETGESQNLMASLSASTKADTGSSLGLLAESEKYRSFLSEVREILEREKRYPWLARLKQLEGTIEVGFQISAEGIPHNVRVLTSSSHEILDDAALAIVKGVRRFPQPPGDSAVQLVLPLDFHLTK